MQESYKDEINKKIKLHKQIKQLGNVYDEEEELPQKYILIWYGVEVVNEEIAKQIISQKEFDVNDIYNIRVHPEYKEFVRLELEKKNQKDSTWVRFKRWLSQLYPFPRRQGQ